ncbi:CDP-6-deoxy-delta-3,4-glucoseen reductase [Bordetella genomosp. 1]|uniref:CDP-6-deoxy-delta-3,4-glucoseen reductase n=1 Tax=Bordetella genomosp. 1 TaxID=1395607 RepID=A0A261SGA5_9BORD|nr:CDP-6-deoxy-delta-3,4-glucoseen reductase [Bordetella genomosp. 1]MDQ8033076.1 CDP-6-deoxy-delta-3,4-glucoseen reductase [Bordetella sp.]OZI36468.1 CDP-6-deoxy-delta-3,4-glucoseen reductase [Bordetella genomosp. 1]OZI57927.1 CDP-6-deoxy-delta-3,4-glucoseen reductase [Bordetella genomosp. 1]
MSFSVTIQPSQHQFKVESGQTVLDAALAAGIVLPYSCRTGACSTCKGKVVSGEVDAGTYPAQILSPEELAAGYTLFCQAKPQTDLVVESTEVRLASDIQIRKMPSRVQTLERIGNDVTVLKLQLPASEQFRYYAGQYVEIILKDNKRRSYSMAGAPHTGSPLELHIRHMPGGLFTDHVFGAGATQMKEREILRLEGPFGSFFLREDSDKPIILLASGTGFAPVKAIVEHMIHKEIRRPVTLYWGGRRPADLYMSALAQSWADTLPDFRFVPVISNALEEDGWTGRTGFVHEAVMADLPDMAAYQVYACGAPPMVDAARRQFSAQCGLPAEEFYADAFTSEADLAKG